MNESNHTDSDRKSGSQEIVRRKVLQIASTAGVTGGSLISTINKATAKQDSDETEIIYAYRHKDVGAPTKGLEPATKRVPTDWYEDYQRAIKKKRENEIDWGEKKGVLRVGVSPGIRGGENTNIVITLDNKHAEEKRGEFPDRTDDIPIKINVADPDVEHLLEACHENFDYHTSDYGSYIPGGVLCEGADDSGSQKCGTTAPAMYDGVGTGYKFCTANHLYGGQETDHRGEPLHHPDSENGDAVGEVYKGHCYDDFIRISPNSDHNPESRIDGAYPDKVAGNFTQNGLADLKSRGEKLRKIGVATMYTSGDINEIDVTSYSYGCTPKTGQLQWGSRSAADAGDSGSVNYHPDPEKPNDFILVGGFNNYKTAFDIQGTAAYSIKDEHGFYF